MQQLLGWQDTALFQVRTQPIDGVGDPFRTVVGIVGAAHLVSWRVTRGEEDGGEELPISLFRPWGWC